ncbi:venom serine protease 34 [Halyomorpha halys]|uniref:venom serine protease 34 n=1 Tax=Halyomorpha halys TaxID=286706 RepID=UPI0006D4E2D8|nr:venom serine protease 34-like [Halyomorpha halys]
MMILIIISIGFHLVAANSNNQHGWCNCGLFQLSTRIINGTVAPEGTHPWAVALMHRYYFSIFSWATEFCGGSIITPKHILTAAHCLKDKIASKVWIAVGQHDLRKLKEKNLISSDMLIIHENYDDNIYDIGLVITSRQIKYNLLVSPVCLPKTKLELETKGAKVTVAGWGQTSISGYGSKVLRQVELDVASIKECSNIYPGPFINQLCTYTNGKSPYLGDSGSAVIWKNPENGEQVQVGLVSYGGSKIILPSVNTDVSAYLDWIEDIVNDIRPRQSICTGN